MGRRVSRQKPTKRAISDLAGWNDLSHEVRNSSSVSWSDRELLIEEIRAERAVEAKKFDAIAGVYQVADRILTQSSVDVKIGNFNHLANNSGTPAWNDGKSIYFNTKVLKELTDETIVSLNGINYHEVAHIIFSPRLNGEFCQKVIKQGLLTGFNILEDQRIETLLISRFPSTELPLTKAVLSYILENDSGGDSFPLIRGRRYIPVEIRKQISNEFAKVFGADFTNTIASLVDEYRTLAFPVDSDRALEIIIEFSKLLNLPSNFGDEQVDELGEYEIESTPIPADTNGTPKCGEGMCGTRLPLKSGRNESGTKQKVQVEQAKAGDTEAESNADSDPDESGTGNQGTWAEKQFNPNAVDKEVSDELAELVKSAIDDLMKSSVAKQEVRKVRSAIRASMAGVIGCANANYTTHSVDMEYRTVAKAFSEELTELLIYNDPSWNMYNPTGKLNVQRTMNMDPNDINSIFDRWDTGNDKFDIEAVILLDNSGSMSYIIKQAIQNAWVIKRAIEEIGGRVTMFVFDDNARLLYDGDDKADTMYRAVGATGGTDPFKALIEAENILAESNRTTKLLFTVSDGQWNSQTKCEEVIQRINALDGAVTNAVLLLSEYWQTRMTPTQLAEQARDAQHKCQQVSVVYKSADLVGVARKLMRGL
jgi:hypothetical protein